METVCRCARVRHVHGTTASYSTCGCRCFPCRLAYDEKVRNRRVGITAPRVDGWIDRTGTRRRIEALHANGWSGGELARLLETTFQNVHSIRSRTDPIYPGTAARVAELYDLIWDKAPTGLHVTKTLRWAARNGFVPPMAWDDDLIDDPEAVADRPGTGAWDHRPCGTTAAARRHYRRGEPLDQACLAASRRDRAERQAVA